MFSKIISSYLGQINYIFVNEKLKSGLKKLYTIFWKMGRDNVFPAFDF